jgi:outer membrane protein assembly factor BamB
VGGAVSSSPAVGSNNVFVGSTNGTIKAFALATGALQWSATTLGAVSSPAIDGSRLVVGSNDHNVYAFDAGGVSNCSGTPKTCTPLWTATTGGAVQSSPAVVNGVVYIGSDDGKLYAFNETNGALLWTATTAGSITASPAVGGGSVFVGSADHKVYAFDAAGNTNCAGAPKVCSPLWSVTTAAVVDSSAAVVGGVVYVADESGVLRALDATNGTSKWSVLLGSGAKSSPAVAGGVIYIGTRVGLVKAYAVSNGASLWSTTTGGPVLASPAVMDSRVYVGSEDASVYSFALPVSCPNTANRIDCENRQTGAVRDEWDIIGEPSQGIEGFATSMSVLPGETVEFKVNSPASSYRLDIYRLGFYGGAGGRKVASVAPFVALPQTQPACLRDSTTQLVDCGNWAPSSSWTVPNPAVSGIYVAKLVRDDGTIGVNHIVFVVRDDTHPSDLLFQTSDTTWEAYNDYGGAGLYTVGPNNMKAVKASYNRPFTNRARGASWLFSDSYPMLRFLEANGYDVSYATGIDSDRFGGHLLQHKVFLSVGHDEYWSAAQRANVDSARANAVNTAFFSGNTLYWKTRWEPSIDGSNAPYRTLVTYKDTCVPNINPFCVASTRQADPTGIWTGLWRDSRFSPPADGGKPENATTGQSFVDACCTSHPMTVNAEEGRLRVWRNTNLAQLQPGSSATFGDRIVGYEFDRDLDNGARPAGLIDLSTTDLSAAQATRLQTRPTTAPPPGDIPQPLGPAAGAAMAASGPTPVCIFDAPGCVHHLTLWRSPSGALVFGAGTVQWSYGLDPSTDGGSATDPRIQQATLNVLADMGAQPDMVPPGLVRATRSTDTTPPTSNVSSPASLTAVAAGSVVTVTGTAADQAGQVGGVEVSVDGGTTWHRASGRANWTFRFAPTVSSGPLTIKSRAADDSGNVETPSAGVTITVVPPSCPCTVFGNAVPGTADSGKPNPAELGMKFTTDTPGRISGVRFYKAVANTGVHVAKLWTSTGTLLASAPFGSETSSGWQQATFAVPVPVTANSIYVASYHTDTGHNADDVWFSTMPAYNFNPTGVDNTPLHMPSGRDASGPNGVSASGPSAFPTTPSLDENFWVDPIFVP